MKPIKKFSATSTDSSSILESANLSPEALAELVQKLGYNNIDEIKKEKALLSKLEALLKEFNPKQDVSEDDAEDIEDEINDLGEPKSLEDKDGEKEEDKEVGTTSEVAEEDEEGSEIEKEIEDDEKEEDTSKEIEDEIVADGEPKKEDEKDGEELVTKDQEVTAEVPGEDDDKESGEEIEVEEETEEKPVAKRRIMTFEDFVQEGEETINKNVSYQDDEEEDEDNALPVADSVETEETKEEEIEETVSRTASSIKSFSQFVSESYLSEEADNGPELKEETPDANGIAITIAKGDGSETAAGISAEKMKMGEPEEKKEEEGEALVTKDQKITKEPETSKDEPAVQGKVVVKESLSDKDAYKIIDAGSKFSAEVGGHLLATQTFSNGNELVDYLLSDFIDQKDHAKFLKLVKNLVESVNEAEIKSDAEFEEYATEILKSAHGADFDEAKAKEVIDGLKSKYKGDFGAMVGALQSTMGQ